MELCYLSRETPMTALQNEWRMGWQLVFVYAKEEQAQA